MAYHPGDVILIGDYQLASFQWLNNEHAIMQAQQRQEYRVVNGYWPTTVQAISKETETERTLRINRYGLWLLAAMIVDLFIMVYQGVT